MPEVDEVAVSLEPSSAPPPQEEAQPPSVQVTQTTQVSPEQMIVTYQSPAGQAVVTLTPAELVTFQATGALPTFLQ